MANQEKHPAREFLYDVSVFAVVLGGLVLLGAGLEHAGNT